MAMVRRRKIWWEPVPEAASYVVYVSANGEAFDPGRFAWEATPGVLFKPVAGRTELTLPDDWPEFPAGPGTYYIGITSKDEMENQSDPFVSSAQFKFRPPSPPLKAGIESL